MWSLHFKWLFLSWVFSGGSDGKESACNVGDPGSVSGLGGSPEEGSAYPLQYSCLENSMGRGTWWDTVYGVTKSCSHCVTNTLTLSSFTSFPHPFLIGVYCFTSHLSHLCHSLGPVSVICHSREILQIPNLKSYL